VWEGTSPEGAGTRVQEVRPREEKTQDEEKKRVESSGVEAMKAGGPRRRKNFHKPIEKGGGDGRQVAGRGGIWKYDELSI